jgi:hypothetical protein
MAVPRQDVQLGSQVAPVYHPAELIHHPPILKEQHDRKRPYPIAFRRLGLGLHVERGDRHPAAKGLLDRRDLRREQVPGTAPLGGKGDQHGLWALQHHRALKWSR